MANVWLNVLADAKGNTAAEVQTLIAKPQEANNVLGGGKGAALFVQAYKELVTLPSVNKSYHELFVALSGANNGAALFYCTTGKDRTGWAAAALLTLLGVPERQVYADYLRLLGSRRSRARLIAGRQTEKAPPGPAFGFPESRGKGQLWGMKSGSRHQG